MKETIMRSVGKVMFVGSMLLLVSGCNQDGVVTLGDVYDAATPQQSVALATFLSGEGLNPSNNDTITDIYNNASQEQQQDIEDFAQEEGYSLEDGRLALVHNPEPATMLLWGIGMAGAALARKRKLIKGKA